jgi:hypothetical protein
MPYFPYEHGDEFGGHGGPDGTHESLPYDPNDPIRENYDHFDTSPGGIVEHLNFLNSNEAWNPNHPMHDTGELDFSEEERLAEEYGLDDVGGWDSTKHGSKAEKDAVNQALSKIIRDNGLLSRGGHRRDEYDQSDYESAFQYQEHEQRKHERRQRRKARVTRWMGRMGLRPENTQDESQGDTQGDNQNQG